MKHSKKVDHTPTPWPKFIFQEDRPPSLMVLLWTIFVYIVALFMLCRISVSQTINIFHQPLTIIYEQTYIDTNNSNTTAPLSSKYYGAHNQSAEQEVQPTKLGEDPTIKGSVLSQKITQAAPANETTNIDEVLPSSSENVENDPGRALKNFLGKDNPTNKDGETVPLSDLNVNEDSQYIALNRNRYRQKIQQSTKERVDNHKNKHVKFKTLRSVTAPIRKSESSVPRLGKISMDIQGSEFGEYEQRLLEAISYRWQLLSHRFENLPPAGEVVIRYIISKDGTISGLEIANNTTSYEAAMICSDAILSQSPQPEWSDDMVAKVGNKKQMMIKFLYY